MRIFLSRWSLFLLLWILFILSIPYTFSRIITAFLLLSISMLFYFLLPILKQPLIGYVVGLVIIVLAAIRYNYPFYSVLLIAYLALEAVFQLPYKTSRLYTVLSSIVSMILLLFSHSMNYIAEDVLIVFFFMFLLLALSQNRQQKMEKQQLYEHLLGEYRHIKRMALKNEQGARVQERTRIARDMHDSVGHKLTALLMQIEMMILKPESSAEAAPTLKRLAKESLEETRSAVRTLKDEEVTGIPSVLLLIRKLESESHMKVEFTTKQGALSLPLSNRQSVVLYRIMQEGLTNAMRYGSSRDVHVTLGLSAIGDLSFRIVNTVHKPIPFQPGFGLKGLKDRVEEIKGSVTFYQTESTFVIEGFLKVEGPEHVEHPTR
ncbi:hypothetical protein AMD01_02180 [Priestia koreensis]|uniref:histidine kinase n=1 Tax=Priestia koreensis TaxID=284581 RepID=A0A0M0LIQ3_9BACI|nr:hypothetical protein AMD01_02180 [Priestia koreensis]